LPASFWLPGLSIGCLRWLYLPSTLVLPPWLM
jgi:hypothetical protein